MAIFNGTALNDTFVGTAGIDTFNMALGGDDTVNGGDDQDTFYFGASLTAADRIDGGGGPHAFFDFNEVVLSGDYSAGVVFSATTMVNIREVILGGGNDYKFTTNDANVAAGESLIMDGSQLGAADALSFDGSAESDGRLIVYSGYGTNIVTGGAGDDSTYILAFNPADKIDGGGGYDYLQFAIDGHVTCAPDTFTNIEQLSVSGNSHHPGTFTTNDGNVAAGTTLAVSLDANVKIFDGSAETDGRFSFLTLGARANTFIGGAGNDLFWSTDGLNAATVLDGQGGYDTVSLISYYDVVIDLTPDSFRNIEQFNLSPYDNYHGQKWQITAVDDALSGKHTLTIDGSLLQGPLSNLDFDGSAESSARFILIGGAGHNDLTGGDGGDSFDLTRSSDAIAAGSNGRDSFDAGARFNAAMHIDGGAGHDSVRLNGDYSSGLTLDATMLSNVEVLKLGAGFDYDLTSNDANVAAGENLSVDGSQLGVADGLSFDGNAESDGNFTLHGGAGADVLRGGAQNDQLVGGGGEDTLTGGGGDDRLSGESGRDSLSGGDGADRMSGGSDKDVFVYGAVGDSGAGGWNGDIGGIDFITDFVHGQDRIDLSAIDADTTLPGDQAFHIASGLNGTAGDLFITTAPSGHTLVEGDVDGDGIADFVIALNSGHLVKVITAADFVL